MRACATVLLVSAAMLMVQRAEPAVGQERTAPARETTATLPAGQEAGNDVDTQVANEAPSSKTAIPRYTTDRMSGRAVWLADALKRRYNVETDADASKSAVALETVENQLLPIIKDARGRAFFSDARLRDVDLELVVRRFADAALIQIIRVYSVKPEGTYEVDYWCDICAIPMYELKECECCQGPTRIRERRVEPGSGATTAEEATFERQLERRRFGA